MRISDGSSDVFSSDLNYLKVRKSHIRQKPSLVIMNPPFNIDSKTKEYIKANYGGRPLLPEVWFQKALELFGTSVPIAMFTPYGFRINQTDNSSRWKKFIEGEYPEITSIASLPKDVFDGLLLHRDVLIFNRSEERRVGKECGSVCRSGWSPYH